MELHFYLGILVCLAGSTFGQLIDERGPPKGPSGNIETPLCLDLLETNLSSQPSPELRSPTFSSQTPSSLSSNTPRKRKYRENIKDLTTENKRLKKEVEHLKTKCATILENTSLEQYFALTYKFCSSPEIASFINLQVSECRKERKGRRYSNEFKRECLAMYYAGPKLYKKILVKKFCLPEPQTLFKLIRNMAVRPGLNNPQLFDMLKMKLDGFQDQSKYCMLCLDEMSIKANLFYNQATDSTVGLAENEVGVKEFKPALHSCVLMLRGICTKWKQPIAFYFCHSTCPGKSLKNIVIEAIQKLKPLGLKVCALTTDMGSNNLQLARLLHIDPENPQFSIDDLDIFYIFDIPHIIKAIRNMLLKYNFIIDDQIISWKFIKMFYDHDKQYPVRAAPKLTEAHINPSGFEKMKVKFASQLFSATVSAGMNLYIRFGHLPAEAFITSQFIDRMDKLFDLLNSSNTTASKRYNMAFKGTDFQIEFLQDCLNFFNKLEVRDGNNRVITNKIKSFKCLKTSINSILNLWNNLKNTAKFKFLFTRRLNQDCLENFFGNIRQQNGNCINPTPIQFQRSFKKLLFLNLFHSGTENCEADIDPILFKLSEIPRLEDTSGLTSENPQRRIIVNTDYQTSDILQKNFIRYICGYLLKKALGIHSCDVCNQYSKAREELDDSSLFIFLKAYENAQGDIFGNLRNPHDDFVNFVTNMEIIFQNNFETFILESNICNRFVDICSRFSYEHTCPEFPKVYVMRLYIRVRLYYSFKNINRNFRNIHRNKLIIWRHL